MNNLSRLGLGLSSAVMMLGVVAGTAEAGVLVDGVSYELDVGFDSFSNLFGDEPSLSLLPWFGDEDLAEKFALAAFDDGFLSEAEFG